MEQAFKSVIALPFPVVKRKRTPEKIIQPPDPVLKLPPRGTAGPVHISTLIKPLQEIINHPQRDRLLAEFFRQEDSGQRCF